MTAVAGAVPQRFYDGLHLREGAHVLDVGCGTGDDVRMLAELVGPHGRVDGVDVSAAMVRTARERGLPENARVQQAEAGELPFEDETFDAVRAERVFQHLTQPDVAAKEIF